MTKTLKEEWTERAEKTLVGKTIVGARYMTDDEVEELGISSSSLILTLDDGLELTVMADDEGNDAGSLWTSHPEVPVLPAL